MAECFEGLLVFFSLLYVRCTYIAVKTLFAMYLAGFLLFCMNVTIFLS